MSQTYHTSRTVVSILFSLLTRCEVKGKENIPEQGPLLVIANHLSLADPQLLGVTLDRPVRFMAKEQLFRFRPMAHFMRSLGAFPIHKGQLDRQAIRQAYHILAQEQALIMFPEGMRSRSNQLRPAFSGAALIASRSGTPVLPIGISGSERTERLFWPLHRPRITVNIGRPFYLPSPRSRSTKQELTELTNTIMQHIAELLPQEYRGHYSP